MARSPFPVVRLILVRGVLLFSNNRHRRPATRLEVPYALSRPEGLFARELLETQTQYWLFRAHQQERAGDFIALDRSAPRSATSTCFAIELKASADLRVGWRGTQLTKCERAARWIEEQHPVQIGRVVPVLGAQVQLLSLLRRRSTEADTA